MESAGGGTPPMLALTLSTASATANAASSSKVSCMSRCASSLPLSSGRSTLSARAPTTLPDEGLMLSGGAGEGGLDVMTSMRAIPGVLPTCMKPSASGPVKPTFFQPSNCLAGVLALALFLRFFLGNLASISAYSSACRSLLERPNQKGHSCEVDMCLP